VIKKTILHLCADLGSDSYFYQQDDDYDVILVGEDVGVENFTPPENVYGIIANPVCTDFSFAKEKFKDQQSTRRGMFLVNHCLRIIEESNPKWWVIENPASGKLKDVLGRPAFTYQPWEYGSPWTKKTALWGKFNMPFPLYQTWESVPKNDKLYVRPGRPKPSLAFLHKSAIDLIPEFYKFKEHTNNDADLRSLCSQGFAREFYKTNN